MNIDQFIPDWAKEKSAPEAESVEASPSWREALCAALVAGVVVGAAVLLTNQVHPPSPPACDDDEGELDEPFVEDAELEAAARLGVDAGASADEIRAALRARLAAARIHPDQGGDHETAAQLIAAKNLLCARARRRVNG